MSIVGNLLLIPDGRGRHRMRRRSSPAAALLLCGVCLTTALGVEAAAADVAGGAGVRMAPPAARCPPGPVGVSPERAIADGAGGVRRGPVAKPSATRATTEAAWAGEPAAGLRSLRGGADTTRHHASNVQYDGGRTGKGDAGDRDSGR